MIRSPCTAAKKRERGPSVSERRAAEEAAAIAAAEKTRRVKPAVHGVPGTVAVQAAAVDGTPMVVQKKKKESLTWPIYHSKMNPRLISAWTCSTIYRVCDNVLSLPAAR